MSQYVVLFLGSVLIVLCLAYSFNGKSSYIYVYPIGMGLLLALIYLKILSRMFSINQNDNIFGIMFILSVILALPCGIYTYAKVLHHFTKEICCGFIMLRLVLKLSFLVDDLKEIKYILYLSAFIYGFFVGTNL